MAIAAWIGAPGISSQTLTVGDAFEDYLRLLQIAGRGDFGSFTVRPSVTGSPATAVGAGGHPWALHLEPPSSLTADGQFQILVVDPQLRSFANSRFPVGRNDGAVWQGKGLTMALDVGVVVTWRAITIEVRPTIVFTENRSFPLAPVGGTNPYAYPWRVIDWPQRFGPDPFWTLDPGQSEVRLDVWGASLGLSSKNLWWGPAIRNPIVMSNNAPGFPHGFLGTDGPLDIGIGDLEARWVWGRLSDSDWFDSGTPARDRLITGIVAAFSPSLLRGLSLGLTRAFYARAPEGAVPLADYFMVLQGVRKKALVTPQNPTGDDDYDQLFSLFGRWVLPRSGFEVYWEWARNDHAWDLRDFLLEPEHSQAYTLGLAKAFDLDPNRVLSLGFELSHLERESTFQVRSSPTYYEHGIVTQGYTQRGQIIGAGIGPGGNAQALSLDLYVPWGRAGTWLERQVHDNDAYYEWAAANNAGFCCHDVSFHWGTRALFFTGGWELGAGTIVTREMNRYFFGSDLWNLNLSLSARWRGQDRGDQ